MVLTYQCCLRQEQSILLRHHIVWRGWGWQAKQWKRPSMWTLFKVEVKNVVWVTNHVHHVDTHIGTYLWDRLFFRKILRNMPHFSTILTYILWLFLTILAPSTPWIYCPLPCYSLAPQIFRKWLSWFITKGIIELGSISLRCDILFGYTHLRGYHQ